MSDADMLERGTRNRRRLAVLLAASLLLFVGMVAGWSRLGGAPSESTEVLGEVFTARSTGNSGKSTPGQGQANHPGNGQPAPPGGNPGNPGNGNGNGPPDSPGTNPRAFGISGSLDEIYPTFDGTLEVTFTNPHRFEIVVTELDVELTAPSGPCATQLPSGVFTIDDDLSSNGVLLTQRHGNTFGTGTVDIDFSVSNDLPDECQGVRFDLAYTGTAIRANQQ